MAVEEIRVINTKEISFENPAKVVGQKLEVVCFHTLSLPTFSVSSFRHSCVVLEQKSAVLEQARKRFACALEVSLKTVNLSP